MESLSAPASAEARAAAAAATAAADDAEDAEEEEEEEDEKEVAKEPPAMGTVVATDDAEAESVEALEAGAERRDGGLSASNEVREATSCGSATGRALLPPAPGPASTGAGSEGSVWEADAAASSFI
jgi:hypothetical protein